MSGRSLGNLAESCSCGNCLLQKDLSVQGPWGHGSGGPVPQPHISHRSPRFAIRFSSVSASHLRLSMLCWFILPCPTLAVSALCQLRSAWALALIKSIWTDCPRSTVWTRTDKWALSPLNSWSSLPSLNSTGLSLWKPNKGEIWLNGDRNSWADWVGAIKMSINLSLITEMLSSGRKEVKMLYSLLSVTGAGNMMARSAL